VNDIDFLRRNEECSRCRVVDDIEATIGIEQQPTSQAFLFAIAGPAGRYFCTMIKSRGDLAVAVGATVRIISMSLFYESSLLEYLFGYVSKSRKSAWGID
jgi:hypothetical protein